MAKGKNLFANVRLVYRRSSPLLKTVVLVTIIASIAAVLFIRISTDANIKAAEEARNQAAQLEQENDQWKDKTDKLGTVDGVKDIAEEELDLVDPDTTVYDSKD